MTEWLLCGVVVRVGGQLVVSAGIRLRSCPGLAATETPRGWVVVHDGFSIDGPDGESPGARLLTPSE